MKTLIIKNIDLMTDEEEFELKNYLEKCNIEYSLEVNLNENK